MWIFVDHFHGLQTEGDAAEEDLAKASTKDPVLLDGFEHHLWGISWKIEGLSLKLMNRVIFLWRSTDHLDLIRLLGSYPRWVGADPKLRPWILENMWSSLSQIQKLCLRIGFRVNLPETFPCCSISAQWQVAENCRAVKPCVLSRIIVGAGYDGTTGQTCNMEGSIGSVPLHILLGRSPGRFPFWWTHPSLVLSDFVAAAHCWSIPCVLIERLVPD